LDANQRTIFITDADDLLAVWRFKRQSSTKRSKNLNIVLTVSLTVLEVFFSNNATCYDLVGEIAFEKGIVSGYP
jgi:hypothetical protein